MPLSGRRFLSLLLVLLSFGKAYGQSDLPPALPTYRVLAIAEPGGVHKPFVDAAKIWLAHEAKVDQFSIDYIEDTQQINAAYLSQYKVFIQLNYPPYNWTPTAMAAFEDAIEKGTIGWVGFHHATLLGEFDGTQMWPWFSKFMGDIRFKKYIPTFASGFVTVQGASHPVMRNLPASFTIKDEEWYTWSRSPRPNVRVLATVDENTYDPYSEVKMGDHPVVWTNEHVKARNVYIFMGHHAELFQDRTFTTMFHNSIVWAAGK